MKPRTCERRARPSSTINSGARPAVSTCLLVTCVLTTCAILLVSVAPCIAAAREHSAGELSSALESPVSSCGKRADELIGVRGEIGDLDGRGFRSVGEETLWIFDADFEDLSGDNLGWLSLDMSGTLEVSNYWHKDTIRINGFEHLGDSTWWCGTYNDCWRQPRGYGNDWLCSLAREFPLSEWSGSDDTVTLEYDQRYAMELSYDYGYTDVSTDGGETWTTLWTQTNAGFAGTPGISSDWDSAYPSGGGHMALDLSEFAGLDIFVRYRFESDGAYSSQDQYNNPPFNSVKDGAWQLDNFCFKVNGDVVWLDDCESPGSNGWLHDNIPADGQTGVVFERVLAPDILRDEWSCYWRPSGWWMAALDAETGRMVDGQNSWLLSPPIDISGTEFLVGQWDAWMDLGSITNDLYDIYLSAGDDSQCIMEHSNFVDAWTQWPHIGPYTARETADWDLWAPSDWLVINWRLWNDDPAEPGAEHWTGLMLDRQRVGVPVGGPPTRWDYGAWDRFHDTYDMAEALEDTAIISISDWDGIIDARLVVSSDAGGTWESSPMIRNHPESTYWKAAPPVDHIAPATEIRYYFESTDGVGNVRTHPKTAPDAYYEFSILPILGSVSEPAILLVDKHGRVIRNEDGEFRQTSERYFREALDILGFEYDVYDVEVPSGSTDQSNGPDTAGYKYYDTQIWFTNDFTPYTIKPFDQINLINWLSQAEQGKERNLLLTGNEIGEELIGYGTDTLSFYSEWLASEYLLGDVASIGDTSLVLRDEGGGFEFMTHGDRACPLRLLEWDYGWADRNYFDVVQPVAAATGAETAAEYLTQSLEVWPAGVAYTHPTMGYQSVNLGFGVEFMAGDLLPTRVYTSGAADRVDLMANVMEYFGKPPTATPTGAEEGEVFANRLGHGRPNPFNPQTTIEYSVAAPGRVMIRVYDAAGRVVRTLVDSLIEAGPHTVAWDGTTDAGRRAASGVYFVRMETAGRTDAFRATRKLVLLK